MRFLGSPNLYDRSTLEFGGVKQPLGYQFAKARYSENINKLNTIRVLFNRFHYGFGAHSDLYRKIYPNSLSRNKK